MYKIATLNKISPVGLKQLPGGYILVENASEADGILVRSQDMHEMELGDKLKAIARAGAGVNNIPLDKCAERGIVVFNTPGANANAVKELVLCGLLLAARNVPSALSWAAGLKEDVSKTVEKGKSQFAGSEILGKTLGVVGLGAIGRKVAASAKALGMEIVGYDPYYVSGGEGISVYSDLGEMLSLCDYVTLHLPANDSTKGMMNAELFDAMKDGTVLLNFSRDKLVNELDLAAAMESGKVAKYVTDFPNDNMVGRENVILLPHLGASTAEAEDNCAVMAVDEIRSYFENGNIINSVNFPRLDMGELGSGIRVAVMIKDVADPALSVMEMLSAAKIKYSRVMASRREDGISYVLAEITQESIPSLLFYGEEGAKIISYRAIEK
ncbi:d-isomer specific 2-hydroxyacid dehydrogenase family protein [Firmicutes bacterium CAG:238]|nr:d-isomer specific 2-hydroxyacid dehydrogenase family protein [Firmicutes bacterium CAG:238]